MNTIISTSIVGKTHRQLFYNNQDAYSIHNEENFTVAVVCDGCGSAPYSEVGARLTSEFVKNYCVWNFKSEFFDAVKLSKSVCQYYEDNARLSLTTDSDNFIRDTFLVTIVGCILSPTQNIIFSAGDGVICIDNSIEIINQNNAPNYIAHNILSNKNYGFDERILSHGEFSRVLIATDGLGDLLTENRAHFIDELFSDTYFRNEIALSKMLSSHDQVLDDTTIVLIGIRG